MSAKLIELNDGNKIPQVGLGVYQASPEDTLSSCLTAFKLGYRHIDTAALYGNEVEVGQAIKSSGIPRDQIYVTTKLWNTDQGYESALKAFDTSLQKLGLDYVDLYLIHSPVEGNRLDSWRALEKIKKVLMKFLHQLNV
jgi:2,5-diketo-D-gluconate reductase A